MAALRTKNLRNPKSFSQKEPGPAGGLNAACLYTETVVAKFSKTQASET